MSAQIPRPIGSIAFALLASGLSISVPANAARAVDCFTAPNSSAPQNSHWYYRTDRAEQRKCWHLRPADQLSQQGAVQTAREPPPAKSWQSVPVARPYSLASFKAFMAHHGGANLSDEDVEKLYDRFLEWSHHGKN